MSRRTPADDSARLGHRPTLDRSADRRCPARSIPIAMLASLVYVGDFTIAAGGDIGQSKRRRSGATQRY
jgi:hypothetical protein